MARKSAVASKPRKPRSAAFWVTTGALVVVVLAASEVAADLAPDAQRLSNGVVQSASDCGLMAEVLKTGYNLDQVFVVPNKPGLKLACKWETFKLDIQPTPAKPDPEAPLVTIGPPRYSWWRTQAAVDVGLKVDEVGGGQVCHFAHNLSGGWTAKGCKAARS